MKKLLIVFEMLAVLLCFLSCNREETNIKKLKKEIENANRECPKSMGIVGDLLSMKFDEKSREVQLYYSLNDDLFSIDVLKDNSKLLHQNMKLIFANDEIKKNLDKLIDAKCSFVITYKGASSGKSVTAKLTLNDLKEIKDNSISIDEINKLLLENHLAIEDSRCPYQIDDGITMLRAYDDGTNIVYVYGMDETIHDLYFIESSLDENKGNISSMFYDPSIRAFLKIVLTLNKGVIYRYQGIISGKKVDIVFTPEELKELIQ